MRTLTTIAKFFCLLTLAIPAAAQGAVDFQRDVRPILSDACFHCHGPDPATRMAGLRLDTREGAFGTRKKGAPIVSGDPAASLLYQRIMERNSARLMPPPHSHKTLDEKQKQILKTWIESGADWSEHWAFSAPKRSAPPVVKNEQWVRNPIDRFLLARLEQEGLAPASEADRRTLARRVSLDLTGLPPSPEEVEAFVKDPAPDAYEKLVDRLLEKPQWGEHRARYWLDAARYADTHGIHIDNYREMWPYRDWVIGAFNRNLSFDRFTIEQLAGDLLENPTLEQRIATGFHRSNPTTNEAGIILDEYEAIYAKDRADTTGAVWLGMTIGCATCHDHKFDPIPTKDFYAMTAFFRNTTQPVMDGNIWDTPPIVVVPRAEDRARWEQISSGRRTLLDRMDAERQASMNDLSKWIERERYRKIDTSRYDKSERLTLSTSGTPTVRVDGKERKLALAEGVSLGDAPTRRRQAIRFSKEGSLEAPAVDWIDADKPFSLSVWFYYPDSDDNFTILSQTDPDDKGRGWTLETGARVPLLKLTGDDGKSLSGRAGHMNQLKPGEWHHITVTYDGSREQAAFAMYIDGKPVHIQGGSSRDFRLEGSIAVKQPIRLGTDTKRYFDGGAIADLRLYDRVVSEEEAKLIGHWYLLEDARSQKAADLDQAEREALTAYYLNREDKRYRKLASQLQDLQDEASAIRRRGAVTHVQQERQDQEPFAHILHRGMYDQPRDKVAPAVPSALPPMPSSYPANRLGLAKWLVSETNPLTSRVTVNRFWQEVFGTGIVQTAEDFGSQGEAPSHPELLDWLAIEFRESGWDVKKLFKLMVTSAAYRQQAATTPEKLEKDPDNRLLSRGPRFRMDGEMVRDHALAASGLLSDKIGGPSVKPYQPKGLWETVAMPQSNTRIYEPDSGDALYRRSLYWFWKRASPPASLEIFNAPTREVCTVRRERTNTPLQALVTMNDPQFVEAARRLAENTLVEGGKELDSRLDYLAGKLLARPLDSREREVARAAYKDFLRHYDSNPADARGLLSVGEYESRKGLPPEEFAALTLLANQMLNLDEVLNK